MIMYFQRIYGLAFIVCYANRIACSLDRFKHGGVGKLLNEKKRTQFVEKGQQAKLQWVFQTDTKIVFLGIVWTIYDRLYKNRSKLVWMDKSRHLFQHGIHDGRAEYEVRFFTEEINKSDVRVTIAIANVQFIHQNTYVCHVIGSHDERSQIKLRVMERQSYFEITSSNGNTTTVVEYSQVTFTCYVAKEAPCRRVVWYKDNFPISSYQENNASFTKIFSKGDEGEYECRANNNFTTASKIINIFVRRRNESSKSSTEFKNLVIQHEPPDGTTPSTQDSRGVVEAAERHESSGMKIKIVPVILIPCSAVLVIVAIIVVIRLQIRKRRAKTRRIARSRNSVGSRDIQLPIIAHESSHVNRRISFESNADTSWSNENFQSTRTGFSYRDSSDEYDQSDSTFTTFTVGGRLRSAGPVQFSRIQQHLDASTSMMGNARSNFVSLSDGEYESYEIDPGLLQDMHTIGEGAFGIVAKATLLKERNSSEKQTVAVKMLKVFASPEDRRDLISELKIMSRIEPHKNVVGLIGCVTASAPMYVIIEFVALGDLLGFLRKSRGLVDTNYVIIDSTVHSSLSQSQLLKMAHDITMGMTHLSRNQVIHRDLAARNVLVGEHLECKITDFGMARDVKLTNYYKKISRGRIPLKWTAIEAIVDDKYTIESDIWSFGILLYEIVTMGGTPYPGLGARELLRKLKSGWRMPRPSHVDTKLYEIMLKCWSSTPGDRPPFSTLARTFSGFNSGDNDYINVIHYDGSLYLDIEEKSPTHSNSEMTV